MFCQAFFVAEGGVIGGDGAEPWRAEELTVPFGQSEGSRSNDEPSEALAGLSCVDHHNARLSFSVSLATCKQSSPDSTLLKITLSKTNPKSSSTKDFFLLIVTSLFRKLFNFTQSKLILFPVEKT